jgi:hypothetical protein
MVRKQLYLTTEEAAHVRKAASREGCAEADIVRRAIDRELGLDRPVDFDADPLWRIVGIGTSGRRRPRPLIDDELYGPAS